MQKRFMSGQKTATIQTLNKEGRKMLLKGLFYTHKIILV